MEEYDIMKAAIAQRKYAGDLLFAPLDGECYRCGKNIYKPVRDLSGKVLSGYSVEYAATHHITGCPHCHQTFCD